MSIGGSGSVKALPLSAQTADISIAGAGNVAATVMHSADVSIMGSGDVTVAGGAKCSVAKITRGRRRCIAGNGRANDETIAALAR